MRTFFNYVKWRYICGRRSWGKPWVRVLWLDALLFAVARCATLVSPWFDRWCRELDRLFSEQYEIGFSMTGQTGRDCWIDAYWDRMTPQEAVCNEVEHWDAD